MKIKFDEDVDRNDRVRVTWEGAYLVQEGHSSECATFDSFFGGRETVTTSRRVRLSVDNPDRVWVESIAPDKVRDRIAGEWVNPDAVLLQDRLDKAEAESERLRATIVSLRENYEASKELWRKRHRHEYWLESESLDGIARAIADGEPEPDPIDW